MLPAPMEMSSTLPAYKQQRLHVYPWMQPSLLGLTLKALCFLVLFLVTGRRLTVPLFFSTFLPLPKLVPQLDTPLPLHAPLPVV